MNQLEQAMQALPETFQRRDVEQVLDVSENKAREFIRQWKADNRVENVTGESYVYQWTGTAPTEKLRLPDRQTDRQIPHKPYNSIQAAVIIAVGSLILGLIGGYWGSALAATPIAAPATATPVAGLRLTHAIPFYWEPFSEAGGALEQGTPYEAIARYGGSWVQIELINADGSRTPVWVTSADVAYDRGLADLQPPPTPIPAPVPAAPPPAPVVVYEPVPVEVHIPPQVQQAVESVQQAVMPTATPAPVATISPALVSSQVDRSIAPVPGHSAPIMGCGPDMNGEYACDRFVNEGAMPETWQRRTIQDMEIDLNNP
jgi:hypothetical protein